MHRMMLNQYEIEEKFSNYDASCPKAIPTYHQQDMYNLTF